MMKNKLFLPIILLCLSLFGCKNNESTNTSTENETDSSFISSVENVSSTEISSSSNSIEESSSSEESSSVIEHKKLSYELIDKLDNDNGYKSDEFKEVFKNQEDLLTDLEGSDCSLFRNYVPQDIVDKYGVSLFKVRITNREKEYDRYHFYFFYENIIYEICNIQTNLIYLKLSSFLICDYDGDGNVEIGVIIHDSFTLIPDYQDQSECVLGFFNTANCETNLKKFYDENMDYKMYYFYSYDDNQDLIQLRYKVMNTDGTFKDNNNSEFSGNLIRNTLHYNFASTDSTYKIDNFIVNVKISNISNDYQFPFQFEAYGELHHVFTIDISMENIGETYSYTSEKEYLECFVPQLYRNGKEIYRFPHPYDYVYEMVEFIIKTGDIITKEYQFCNRLTDKDSIPAISRYNIDPGTYNLSLIYKGKGIVITDFLTVIDTYQAE